MSDIFEYLNRKKLILENYYYKFQKEEHGLKIECIDIEDELDLNCEDKFNVYMLDDDYATIFILWIDKELEPYAQMDSYDPDKYNVVDIKEFIINYLNYLYLTVNEIDEILVKEKQLFQNWIDSK